MQIILVIHAVIVEILSLKGVLLLFKSYALIRTRAGVKQPVHRNEIQAVFGFILMSIQGHLGVHLRRCTAHR